MHNRIIGIVIVLFSLLVFIAIPNYSVGGRFSLQAFVLPLLLLYVIVDKSHGINKSLKKSLFLYIGYIIVFLLVSLVNGDAAVSGDIFSILVTYVNCVLVSVAISHSVLSYKDFRLLSTVFIVVLCVNVIFSFLQMLNVSYIWDIWHQLNPDLSEKAEETLASLSNMDEQVVGENYCPGLFPSTVANGYFMATFGLLPLCLAIRGDSFWIRIAGSLLFLLSFISLYIIQQRAAFLVFSTCSIIAILKTKGNKRYLFIVLFIIGAIYLISRNPLQHINLGRFADMSLANDSRTSLYEKSWEYISQHLLLGGRTEFIFQVGKTPHNFVFNAFIYAGLVGACILFFLAFRMCKDSIKQIIHLENTSISGIRLFSALGTIAFFLIGFVHNDSLVTGAPIIFILYSLVSTKKS